jgi:hypothetical protein
VLQRHQHAHGGCGHIGNRQVRHWRLVGHSIAQL